MKSLRIIPVAIIAFGLAVPVAAELTDDDARALAGQAEELQTEGRYDEAVGLVNRELARCGGGACRSRLSYTLGYLHERQSLREPEATATSLLELSASGYARVLEYRPHHWPTVLNLADVYVRLGDGRQAESVLRSSLDVGNPERRAAFALALGDLYRSQERRKEAVEAYRVAVSTLPYKSTPKRREILTGSELLSSQAGELMDRLRSWESETPDVARQGYQEILARVWEIDPQIAENALLSWLKLTSRRTDFMPDMDVRRLSSDWRPVKELQAFVAEPAADRFSSWWFEDLERADVLAPFVLAVGRSQETPQAANRVWQAALDMKPPAPLTGAWSDFYNELDSLLLK